MVAKDHAFQPQAMGESWETRLERWRQAGLIEPATAETIRAWERDQPSPQRLRVPVLVAVALGGVLAAAGLLLFVSTHWEALAPGQRFGLLLALVVGLHGCGAAAEERFPPLAVSLHGVGSVALLALPPVGLLWLEVTLPEEGPPRPIRLEVKRGEGPIIPLEPR